MWRLCRAYLQKNYTSSHAIQEERHKRSLAEAKLSYQTVAPNFSNISRDDYYAMYLNGLESCNEVAMVMKQIENKCLPAELVDVVKRKFRNLLILDAMCLRIVPASIWIKTSFLLPQTVQLSMIPVAVKSMNSSKTPHELELILNAGTTPQSNVGTTAWIEIRFQMQRFCLRRCSQTTKSVFRRSEFGVNRQ